MSQSHLVIDFPVRGPAIAKALPEELPAVMPDLAKAQDDLETVHFSRFMVEGDEKLLFISDIDGEVDEHIERLVESAGPVFDSIFEHVDDPPATPVADDPQRTIKWLTRHVREPLDTYFAYEDASVQDIKACARAAGFTGNTSQAPLLTYMSIKSRLQGFALKLAARSISDDAYEASDSLGTLHFADWVPFEHNHIAFFTVYDGDFEKYIQDFAEKTAMLFDAVFPHVDGAPPTPSQRTPRRSISGLWTTTIRRSGFTAPIRGSRFKTSEPYWPTIARHHRPRLDRIRFDGHGPQPAPALALFEEYNP